MLGLLLPLDWCLLGHYIEAIKVWYIVVNQHLVQLAIIIDCCLLQLLLHLVLLRILLHLEH